MFLICISGSLLASNISKEIHGEGDENVHEMITDESDRLVVLWTSGDREVFLKMIHMYSFNAKKRDWWKEVVIIVWGPSSRLLATDHELQEKVKELIETGVILKACKGCSDWYGIGVSEKLKEIGVEVLYVGGEFTEYLKSKSRVLTL